MTDNETVAQRMIHTTDTMWEAVRDRSDAARVTMSEWVRQAIAEKMDREDRGMTK
jgi:hypothetical protein